MLDIHELEKRQLRYKLKSYIPYVVIFVSLLVITAVVFMVLTDKTTTLPKIEHKSEITPSKTPIQKQEKQEKAIVVPEETTPQEIVEVVEIQEIVVQDPQPKTVEKNETKALGITKIDTNKTQTIPEKKLLLKPSMNFVENLNNRPYSTAPVPEKKTTQKVTHTTVQQEVKPVVKKTVQRKEPNQDIASIQIKKNNTYQDISDVIRRFRKNNNPALSLFIAKKYYELGEYKKSYNYALITNEINNNIDASWIIFSKSLVKLNKRKLAIKTLQRYIEHSDSNKAKILLDEILSGKLNANE